MTSIGVIGAGAWGTALAHVQAEAGRDVILWAREPEVVESIKNERENTLYLPGVELNDSIQVTNSLSDLVDQDIILVVTPAQFTRSTLESIRHESLDGKPIVICSKGIEIETATMLSTAVTDALPNSIPAVMSGPCFAREVALGMPTAVTIACEDKDVAKELANSLGCRNLRPYITDDVLGAQIGGSVKNVLAIACGAVYGMKLGENARAALITRGVAEMGRLAKAMGADEQTLMGMCGFGDVMLTCSSMQSRNFSLGVMLGEGKTLKQILSERNSVTEGVHTAKALVKLAKANAVDMPIAETVYNCLCEGVPLDEAVAQLLDRPFAKNSS
ncbi:MAG: glycerol-3-phosphate acyltransferase [Alphaproteobacteria bacterium]|nr:MAG: glycerol-3-phosphate acyltransferase [Alphaproteobacteria bacterium]